MVKNEKFSVIGYIKEVRLELSKVIWPKRREVIKLTLTVLIIVAIVGIYVGGIDLSLTKMLGILLVGK